MTTPLCSASGCGQPAVLQWNRYMTAAELASAQSFDATLSANITAANSFIQVCACATHQLPLSAACMTHQSTCSAPPSCDCTPVVAGVPFSA